MRLQFANRHHRCQSHEYDRLIFCLKNIFLKTERPVGESISHTPQTSKRSNEKQWENVIENKPSSYIGSNPDALFVTNDKAICKGNGKELKCCHIGDYQSHFLLLIEYDF